MSPHVHMLLSEMRSWLQRDTGLVKLELLGGCGGCVATISLRRLQMSVE